MIITFFSKGEKNFVRCFHCDGSLCNCEHAEDPSTEQARCTFIKSIQGKNIKFPMMPLKHFEHEKGNFLRANHFDLHKI